MKKQKPGPQGLANLQTWRLPFSSDVLGAPDLRWTASKHEPAFFERKGRSARLRSLRNGKPRA